MQRIAVFTSGNGSNLQRLIDETQSGNINGNICVVVSSKPDTYALTRAERHSIPRAVVSKKHDPDTFDQRVLDILSEYNADIIVLAGYLTIFGPGVTAAYRDRIINIHPALIPAFCGKSFYGIHVHRAVIEYGVKVTGATTHFVNDVIDGGAIIMQKSIEVLQQDTPETLQRRVLEQCEWEILPKTVALVCDGRVSVQGRRTVIS